MINRIFLFWRSARVVVPLCGISLKKYIKVLKMHRYYDGALRRSAGAVERGGLENRCGGNSTVGSNPTFSARFLTPEVLC